MHDKSHSMENAPAGKNIMQNPIKNKWARPDLNRRPSGYEPDAPPG